MDYLGVLLVEQERDGNAEETMNKELMEWIKETKEQPNNEQDEKIIKKEPEGKCEICGNNESKFVCSIGSNCIPNHRGQENAVD